MPIYFVNTASGVTQDCSYLQNERKESKGDEGGTEGIGSGHKFDQSTNCSHRGSFPHPSKDQSQGGTIASRAKSAYGRMSLLLSYVIISNIYIVINFHISWTATGLVHINHVVEQAWLLCSRLFWECFFWIQMLLKNFVESFLAPVFICNLCTFLTFCWKGHEEIKS